jgi:hypothetical protein
MLAADWPPPLRSSEAPCQVTAVLAEDQRHAVAQMQLSAKTVVLELVNPLGADRRLSPDNRGTRGYEKGARHRGNIERASREKTSAPFIHYDAEARDAGLLPRGRGGVIPRGARDGGGLAHPSYTKSARTLLSIRWY